MTIRVFIVEDDRMVIETYREILKMHGFEVIGWSYDGEEAIQKLKKMKPRPDVVLMDQRLPMKSGVETTLILLLMDPHLKILFISADGTAKSAAMASGAVGFVRKPFDLKEFVSTIKQVVEKGQPQ